MAWKPDYFRLFISHVSSSHAVASEIATVLREWYGVEGFVAHADIVPSADWQNEIEASLKTMDALLALLTPGFSKSLWCNQEVGWALGRQSLAISVRLGEDPTGFVGRFQAIPGGDGKPHGVAERVFTALAKNPATAAGVGISTSMFLRQSETWEQIQYRIAPALSLIPQFTDQALDNLQAAFNENSHVRTSHYLDPIRSLLATNGRQVPPKR
jgi:hypothetical protein